MKKKIAGILLLSLLLISVQPLQAETEAIPNPGLTAFDTIQMELLQGGQKSATCAGAIIFLVGEATFGAVLASAGGPVGAAWWFARMMGETVAVVGACA